MSGGHWNYAGFTIQDRLYEIGSDPIVEKRWPRIAKAMTALADWVYDTEHAMDWDLCGDSLIENDGAWQAIIMDQLQTALCEHDARAGKEAAP